MCMMGNISKLLSSSRSLFPCIKILFQLIDNWESCFLSDLITKLLGIRCCRNKFFFFLDGLFFPPIAPGYNIEKFLFEKMQQMAVMYKENAICCLSQDSCKHIDFITHHTELVKSPFYCLDFDLFQSIVSKCLKLRNREVWSHVPLPSPKEHILDAITISYF